MLCCTDLAARGLDLPAVDHVVQLDMATDVVSHLHRVGRAARAGTAARATSFVAAENRDLVAAITAGDTVDQAFSRKRGLRKKLRKAGKPLQPPQEPARRPGPARSSRAELCPGRRAAVDDGERERRRGWARAVRDS